MLRYNYYGIKGDDAWHIASNFRPSQRYQPRLFRESDLVWCQGIQGGVRLIHQNWRLSAGGNFRKLGYVTTNEKSMQEFAWVKLKAKTIS